MGIDAYFIPKYNHPLYYITLFDIYQIDCLLIPPLAPPYLTKQLKQLEDLEGLVTLSTDNENKNAEIFSSDDLSSKVSNSPAEIAKNPRSKESAACTAREGRETSILRACITETVSDKTDRATRVYPDCNHEEEGPPPIEEKSIPTELKVTYSDSIQDDSTRYPSLSSHVRNEERLGPANTGNRLNVVYTTSTSVGRTLTATDTSETVTTKERWTQTESAPSPPTVDFYLWERRRLACNGWGYHLHNGDPPLPPVFPNGQFINPDGHPCGGPQKIFPSKSKSSTRSDLGVRRCNSAEAAVSPCTTKTVSFSTQTRSPSIKPSSLQIKNVSGHSHSLSHKSDPKSQTYDSEPGCVITSEVATDLPVHVSGASTPFDSTSATPRAYDKTLDLLESSRSTSVLSDSGTSLSIPSEIISSAKPFTNRTRQNKSACGMADVSTDHPSLATTPPLSGSEGMGSPHSPPAEPTLKVEYVTKVWDAYISDFLLASDHIKEAAIFDRVTATCIAASFDFIISSSEFDQVNGISMFRLFLRSPPSPLLLSNTSFGKCYC